MKKNSIFKTKSNQILFAVFLFLSIILKAQTTTKEIVCDGEPKTNKQLINKYLSAGEQYKIGDIIFNNNNNNNGKLIICDNLLTTFSDLFKESKDVKVILPLKYYSSRLIDNQRKDIFNNQEKIKILAYLANLYDPLFKQNHHDGQDWGQMTILADYRDFIGEEEWIKAKNEYKLNNYYDLPNLKSAIEYADMFDSVGAPN